MKVDTAELACFSSHVGYNVIRQEAKRHGKENIYR